MLSNHSFNALLKTLEEPPPHVKFLLATTDPQKLPVTVLSRCLQFSLKRLSANLIGERLKFIAAAEKLDYQPAALALLARAAEGSMRDALSLLDQLIAFGGGALTEADARAMLGTIDRGHVAQIVEALSLGDGAALMARVGELDRDAPDYDRALVELAALLQRHRHRADRPRCRVRGRASSIRKSLTRLAKAHGARGCAALLPDRARRPARSSHGARPAPRIRDDAPAHAGISAGGCRAGLGRSGRRRADARSHRAQRRGCARSNGGRARAAAGSAAGCRLDAGLRLGARRCVAVGGDRQPRRHSIDRCRKLAFRRGGRGSRRHGSATRLQLRAGLLRQRRAGAAARCRGGRTALEAHRGQAGAGPVQVPGPRHPRRIRGIGRPRHAGAAARAGGPGAHAQGGGGFRAGSRRQGASRSASARKSICASVKAADQQY